MIILGICRAVRLLNSQRRENDIIRYKKLCQTTYQAVIESFPWVLISPSLHRVLAHSAELIEMNDLRGLGSQSEEGLEALNKSIRFLKSHGARKTSISDNMKDTLLHMWRNSSPLLVNMDREKKRRSTKIVVQGEIESLIESIFVE